MSALISCIVPTRNGERHIAETIRSILDQTHRPIETIVVDDESTDRTAEVAAGFGPLVRVISQQRGGPAAARNRGMCIATGAYFAFLDHDDLWERSKLALQVAAFESEPELDVCVGHVRRFKDGPADDRVFEGPPVAGYLTTTMLARRSAFDRVGPLNTRHLYSDSAEWFLRARELKLNVRLLPETLTFHRDHAENLSLDSNGERSRAEFLHLLKAKLDKSRASGTTSEAGP